MKKTIVAFITTLLLGTYLVHADVYVRCAKYSKPTIITKEEFEAKLPGSKVETKHGNFGSQEVDYELVILDSFTRYVHYVNMDEKGFWKALNFQVQSGQSR